jgi:hypothetical protein
MHLTRIFNSGTGFAARLVCDCPECPECRCGYLVKWAKSEAARRAKKKGGHPVDLPHFP